jgi:Tfp pilus assembly protein PilO
MNTTLFLSRVRYGLRQLSAMGVVGLALLIAAAVLWLNLDNSARQERQSLQRRLQVIGVQLTQGDATGGDAFASQEEQLQGFYAALPSRNAIPENLKRIFRAADKNALVLNVGEYTQVQVSNERIGRYRVTFPVKGSFPQILLFIDKVLRENATIALESAAFKRDKVDDAAVEAKLVFLIFVDGVR